MILTVTFNPSIDSLYITENLTLGKLNRLENPVRMVGGKGINSGRTSQTLGAKVITTGFLAGTTGKLAKELLYQEPFQKEFLQVEGETRNATTFMHDNLHTEVVEEGPVISEEEITNLLNKIMNIWDANPDIRVICISGSANMTNQYLYTKFIAVLKELFRDTIKILVDISGTQLTNLLNSDICPDFIKPNIHELSELSQVEITTKREVIDILSKNKLFSSIPMTMISCGSKGAIVRVGEEIYDLSIPEVELVNSTGSGDATVGGIAYALDCSYDLETTLRYGMACGMANAMERGVGQVNPDVVENLLSKIEITKLTQKIIV
ncbi:MAG: 1-phosphofructokinase family hexose kinase [Lactobacillales bacterium]|jgi:tagatose 6-phosphate kinase|nr:1-phosphofructokinase family hexose kinase [Lactobacillales bacterium]